MNLPWLAHYDEDVPKAIGTYPEETLASLMSKLAEERPHDTALVFKGRHLTYAQVDRAAAAFARGLAKRGIQDRDRVALVLPNCPQFVIAALAVWRMGGIVHALNPIYTEREIEEALRTIQPQVAIVLTPFYKTIKETQSSTFVRRVIATNIKEYLPPVLNVLFTLVKEKKEGHRITIAREDHWFQDVLRDGEDAPIGHVAARPDDSAAILMSGGTTGTPKGVLISHRSLVISGTQISAWLHEPLTAPGASLFLPLPLFHIYGLGVLSASVISGVPIVLVPNPRDIGDLLDTIKRERPSILCAVPTLLSAIMSRPEVADGTFDFSSVTACFSGAAALMAETKNRFETMTGARIVEGYSLTEAAMALCVNPYRGPNKIGSVGMPLPDVKVRIVDDETGLRELPAGQTGEIVLTAPQLMQGYWSNPEETAKVLRIMSDGSTGLYTGDLGYLDEDGYLFIVDRKKDLIKTSGLQVWPREVEEVLSTHPAVSEAGVAGLPDERKGEIVAAWVVRRPGEVVSADDLRQYCKEKLAPFKIPSRIEFRDELPKTMVGKVLRRKLVAEAKALDSKTSDLIST
jgi:long-chain acyl-CoA synthetase